VCDVNASDPNDRETSTPAVRCAQTAVIAQGRAE
jgi:hypothetical protein